MSISHRAKSGINIGIKQCPDGKAASERIRSKPLLFKVTEGQVGQESNLQPAVLDFALSRSLLFVDVRQSRNFLGLRTPAFTIVHLCSS
jgi:hypothetical protein